MHVRGRRVGIGRRDSRARTAACDSSGCKLWVDAAAGNSVAFVERPDIAEGGTPDRRPKVRQAHQRLTHGASNLMGELLKAFLASTGGTLTGAVLLYVLLRFFEEPLKSLFHIAATKELEDFKVELQRDARESERRTRLENSFTMHQQSILTEATRFVVRIAEIFHRDFRDHYEKAWDPSAVNRITPEANKRDTAVYRLLRFWGAYNIYQSAASGLPPHPRHSDFCWYIDKKITPVLASGNFPGDSIMWRDTIIETGESMVTYSNKWKQLRAVGWQEFVELIVSPESPGPFLDDKAHRLADFLKKPSVRLALFSVFMIDLVQDTEEIASWEHTRDQLLAYLKDHDDGSFSIYGKVADGRNDVSVVDLATDKRPRNIFSVFYDREDNPMNYRIN